MMKVQYWILVSAVVCGFVTADGDHHHSHSHGSTPSAAAAVAPASADYSVPTPQADYSVPNVAAPSAVASYSRAPVVAYGYQIPTAYQFYPEASKKSKLINLYNKKIQKVDAIQGKIASKFFDKWSKKAKYPTHSYAVPQVSYDDGTGASYGHSAVKYIFLPLSFAKNKDYKGSKGYVNDYTGSYGDVYVEEGYGQPAEPVPTQYVYLPLAFAKNKDYKGNKGYIRNYEAGLSEVQVIPDDPEPVYREPAPQLSYGAPAPVYDAPEPVYAAPAAQIPH